MLLTGKELNRLGFCLPTLWRRSNLELAETVDFRLKPIKAASSRLQWKTIHRLPPFSDKKPPYYWPCAKHKGRQYDFAIFLRHRIRAVLVSYLIETKRGFFETHCDGTLRKYRGRGLGIVVYSLMFELALSKGLDLRSSLEPSDAAKRIWESKRIRSRYRIVKAGSRFKLMGRLVSASVE